jgi:hypothetical protein
MIMRRRTAALSVGHEIVSGFVYLLVTKRSFALETKRSNIKEAKPDTINPNKLRKTGVGYHSPVSDQGRAWIVPVLRISDIL